MADVEELAGELDPEAVRIGATIREFRLKLGWTLKELGIAVGRSHGQLSKIERGIQRAPDPLCHAIADALGVRRAAIVSPGFTEALETADV